MNKKILSLIKNFIYAVSANFMTLLIGAIMVLIVPKVIGVEEYGYWQLYVFYCTYVGIFHFGWNDGIYLRYGGQKYEDLDKKLFFSQYCMYTMMEVLVAVGVFIIAIFFVSSQERMFIILMTLITLVIANVRYLIQYILQLTGRIKEYAKIIVGDRIVYFVLVLLLLVIGITDYRLLIFVDIIAKTVSLVLGMVICKEIVFRKVSDFHFTFYEAYLNISVGIKLMLSNIASSFIVGVVKLGIERSWSIIEFGKVSLTLSISSLVLVFINSISIIVYPVLRRIEEEKVINIYSTIRTVTMPILLLVLFCYYPLKVIMILWLPEYASGLEYMSILFPMVIFQGHLGLLVTTYLKTLRKEKTILYTNVIVMVLSILFTIVTTVILKNLDYAIMSILILIVLKCVLSEILLASMMKISVAKGVIQELFLTSVFVISSWNFNMLISMFIYGVSYVIYILVNRKSIAESVIRMKQVMSAS